MTKHLCLQKVLSTNGQEKMLNHVSSQAKQLSRTVTHKHNENWQSKIVDKIKGK